MAKKVKILFFLLFLCNVAFAERTFYCTTLNFEESESSDAVYGNIYSPYADTGEGSSIDVVCTDQPHSGKQSVELVVGGDWANANIQINDLQFCDIEEGMYIRIFVFIPTGTKANDFSQLRWMWCYDTSWNESFSISYDIDEDWCVFYNDATDRTDYENHTLTENVWHSIELYYQEDTGATDGEIHLWIDGVNIIWEDNLDNAGNLANIRIGINSDFDSYPNTFYLDDIVISKTYIGSNPIIVEGLPLWSNPHY